jgi:hypothetical protein
MSTGDITTSGAAAHGIYVNSPKSNIDVITSGNITVSGAVSSGIFVTGDIDPDDIIITNEMGTIQGGSGTGAGVTIEGGVYNVVTNKSGGVILALSGDAIIATGGYKDNVYNHGTVTGNVDLGDNDNLFHNHAGGVFNSGPIVNVGAGNLVINEGTISPGGTGTIATTTITGDFVQGPGGVFLVDLDQNANSADLITVTGTALVGDSVAANQLSPIISITSGQVDVLTATGGVTNNGVTATDTAVVDLTVLFPDANTMAIAYTVDFTPPPPGSPTPPPPGPPPPPPFSGLTPNQHHVGETSMIFLRLVAGRWCRCWRH